jgi:hypothetical protein
MFLYSTKLTLVAFFGLFPATFAKHLCFWGVFAVEVNKRAIYSDKKRDSVTQIHVGYI